MTSDQRRFQRFAITGDAVAVDSRGQTLGRVTTAGGGGMGIALSDSSCELEPGQHLSITIVEPGPDTRHTIDVLVRYRHENSVGFEFVTGRAASEP